MLTSIVIRTFNEEKHLDRLLTAIAEQQCSLSDIEIIVIDSGSNDSTLEIARWHNCRITHIEQADFTFGRSLNYGCKFARGENLVFVSGHCIPVNEHWLENLIKPLVENKASYCYGRQQAFGATKFSEKRHFEKWFPGYSKIPQKGCFCNNANAALRRKTWETLPFNEELTGLEDMYLARQIVKQNENIAYVAEASVFHIHEEHWSQVKRRYEREAIALQKIMPEVHFTLRDLFGYFFVGVFSDYFAALGERVFLKKLAEIPAFRWMQYWGTYRGNHEHRKLSEKQKHSYFYPTDSERK